MKKEKIVTALKFCVDLLEVDPNFYVWLKKDMVAAFQSNKQRWEREFRAYIMLKSHAGEIANLSLEDVQWDSREWKKRVAKMTPPRWSDHLDMATETQKPLREGVRIITHDSGIKW